MYQQSKPKHSGLRRTTKSDLFNTEISLVCASLFFLTSLLFLLVCVEMDVNVKQSFWGSWKKEKLSALKKSF